MKQFPLFEINDIVKLLPNAVEFKCGSVIPLYREHGLQIGNEFKVTNTLIGETNQVEQYLSIEDENGNPFDCYPSWCFEIVKKSNSGLYEAPLDFLVEL